MRKKRSKVEVKERPSAGLLRWLSLWFLLYVAGVLLYNVSFPYTREIAVHRLQAVPAAHIINLIDDAAKAVPIRENIFSPQAQINIMRGCDGFEAWLLLATSLITFPMAWKKKLRALFLGSLLIFVLNLARIVTIYFLVKSRPELFDLVHGLIWQSVMILAAILFVLANMDLQSRVKPGNESSV